MTSDIEISVKDGTQILRLNRSAKKNALTSAMYAALADALEAGDRDERIVCHLFTGSGGIFSAGNDIKDFLETSRGSGALSGPIARFVRILPRVAKPMIATVEGPAIGIGTTLLLHCDLVYAAPNAAFSTPFLDLGLVPEAGSSLLAPHRMGYVRAFEMLVLGEPFTADRALEAGLVNAVLPTADLEAVALKAARRLAMKPPGALMAARRLMRGDADQVLRQIEAEVEVFNKRLASPEAREAFQAFLEKRPAQFRAGPARG